MPTYCEYVLTHAEDAYNRIYHDTVYGFPLDDDNALFERLILEINQAGLSWLTILKKADNFRRAYEDFNIARVAAYGTPDINRLLSDSGIIRNHLKINAAIENARRLQILQQQYGSFKAWLDSHHSSSLEQWVKLFKANFVFTGGEIAREFLLSTGYLQGAHDATCPVYAKVIALKPAWTISKQARK